MKKEIKRVLIISPNFPPVNSADMHRVRHSLPYFKELGWEPVVIAVEEKYVESYSLDALLLKTIPEDIEIHKIKALDVRYTRKLGLGSLSLRSYFYFQKKGDELLRQRVFDLVYFSTTSFHVMALGRRWKKKFGVPFILDIQDPWRSDFYLDKPASERPPKFFISYNIDKYLEARTLPVTDGIISVSKGYNDVFMQRYTNLVKEQFRVIPFGASYYDFEIMKRFVTGPGHVALSGDKRNIVYIGRGGHDMKFALQIIFQAFKKGLHTDPDLFAGVHFWFIGTSYAPPGTGQQTILPLAKELNIGQFVTEIPDRIPYFESLFLLQKADILLVPGSTDTAYTASKIYPYIITGKPLLAVFNSSSSVADLLSEIGFGDLVRFDPPFILSDGYVEECWIALRKLLGKDIYGQNVDTIAFEPYTAYARTREQVTFFNEVVAKKNEAISDHNDTPDTV